MAWWQRTNRPTRSPSARPVYGQTAAAQRYDLANKGDVERLLKMHDVWQQSAWYYVDQIGVLGDAVIFVGNAFRRIVLQAAFIRDPADDPIHVRDAVPPTSASGDLPSGDEVIDIEPDDFLPEVWAREAEAIVHGFRARDGGQAVLMERLGVNLFVPGEAVLINHQVPARRPVSGEDVAGIERVDDWEVRSVDEIVRDTTGGASGDDRSGAMLVDRPDQKEGVPLAPTDFVERLWRKHPRWSGWATSSVRAALGTLEEMDLLEKLARVSIRQRILAGILLKPDEMDFADADQPAGEGSGLSKVTFDRELSEVMASVLLDEQDMATVVPVIASGPGEVLDHMKWLETPRRYTEDDRAQYEDAVKKFGRTIELPTERTVGVGDVNHWTAWYIGEEAYEAYLAPLVGIAAEGLTYALLRPMLLEAGCPQDIVDRLIVVGDASQLVRRPDRGKVADKGMELFALSSDAWRRANGYGEDDAPSDEELGRRLVLASRTLDASILKVLLKKVGILTPEEADSIVEPPQPGDGTGAPGAGDGGDPTNGPPSMEAVAAAAHRLSVGQTLSLADRVLTAQTSARFDAAVTRAVERASARLRTAAQQVRGDLRSQAQAALASGRDVPIGQALGDTLIAALTPDDDLFAGAFDDALDRFDRDVSDVQAVALAQLGALAGDRFTEPARAETERQQADDRAEARDWLAAALLALSAAVLRGGNAEEPGEFDPNTVVPPGLIREALARAGGERPLVDRGGGLSTGNGDPVGGVATGALIRVDFARAGFPWSGYIWNYTLAARKEPFHPHLALAGTEFDNWEAPELTADASAWPYVAHYRPGDHRHCKCDFAPIIAEAQVAAALPSPPEV